MDTIVPLPVVVPLLAAALLAGTASFARRWAADLLSLAAATAAVVFGAILMARSAQHGVVLWFGGWTPRHGVALGISFAIDPLGAGVATFAALMTVAALVFSWKHLETVDHVFHALVLVFLAAMAGFALSGDLFNMFVFFELMSVTAYALTGYRVDKKAPLEGSLNFAIVNSIGGFLVLCGIGLIYGRTGALNLAQIGQSLAGHPPDGLVIVAFGLIVSGFLVKAAIVPFHFWLADAYSVAPTPVLILFSAVMSELGLYAIARIYWTAFSGPLGPHAEGLRAVLVAAGVVTALLGALLCFLQRHLKRMLAFATVGYMGLFLIGIALLTPDGLAGTAVYVVGDGLVKASLFVCVGIVQHRLSSVDRGRLHGRGRALWVTGPLFALGGLALAAMPPFGSFTGKSMLEDAVLKAGYGWLPPIFLICSALTGGAVLRAAGGIFLGLGPAPERLRPMPVEEDQESEARTRRDRTPLALFFPAIGLLAGALALGLIPDLPHAALSAAARLQDRAAYVATVLGGARPALPHVAASIGPSTADWLYAAGSTLGAVAVAAIALLGRERAARLPAVVGRAADGTVALLRAVHSGHPGDYVAWLTAGVATFGGLFALTLH